MIEGYPDSPTQRYPWRQLWLFALMIPIATTGCIDTTGLGEIAKAVDQFTDSLRKESSNWNDQSELWRKEFADLSAYLRSKGQEQLADDVERSGKSLITAADNSWLKGNIDYLEDKLKAYLRELASELRIARRRYHNGEVNRDEVYTSVMERLAQKKIFLDPVVQNLNPNHLYLTHDSATNAVLGPRDPVEISGYGFLRPADETGRYRIEVIGIRGVRQLRVDDFLSIPTDKTMRLNLARDGTFEPGDKKLVLYTNATRPDSYEKHGFGITITPMTVEKKVDPPPPYIHRVVFDMHTLTDDKNKTAQLKLLLILDGDELHMLKEVGRQMEFDKDKHAGTFILPQPGEYGNDFEKYSPDKRHAILFNQIPEIKDAAPQHSPIEIKKDSKLTARVVYEKIGGDIFIPNPKWDASITVDFQQWDGKAYKSVFRKSENRYFDPEKNNSPLDFTVEHSNLMK